MVEESLWLTKEEEAKFSRNYKFRLGPELFITEAEAQSIFPELGEFSGFRVSEYTSGPGRQQFLAIWVNEKEYQDRKARLRKEANQEATRKYFRRLPGMLLVAGVTTLLVAVGWAVASLVCGAIFGWSVRPRIAFEIGASVTAVCWVLVLVWEYLTRE